MELTWQGRFCVRLRSRDATVVADPFPADVGPTGRGLSADIVTFSHREPLPPGALRQLRKATAPSGEEVLVPASLERAFVLNSPGEFEVRQVLMTGVRTDGGADTAGDGRNIAFVFELDGLHVCHLGDIGTLLTQDELGEIGSVELLCIPVGGALSATAAGEPGAAKKGKKKAAAGKTKSVKKALSKIKSSRATVAAMDTGLPLYSTYSANCSSIW